MAGPETPPTQGWTVRRPDDGACHCALAMTLVQTAKPNGVDPMALFTDVPERVVDGRTKAHEWHALLPRIRTDRGSGSAAPRAG